MRVRALLLAIAVSTAGLAGCLGDTGQPVDEGAAGPEEPANLTPVEGWSTPAEPARYEVLDGVQRFVPSFDDTELSIGVFHPDVPGCDWNKSELPERCQLPVVLDAGPYYLDGVTEPRQHPPSVQWFATRGYHVVQMSLRGTGESGGCFVFKNPDDVRDVDRVIDHLANRSWSDGDVGMIGRSYDGTGAWAGAASGNPHLETIVPISGAVGGPDLYYKNGTSEQRGFAQPTFYYLFAFGIVAGDPTYRVEDWPGTVCPEAAEDWARGPQAGATGDASSEYWQSRDLTDDILADYDGSAWVVHGLRDYNVNPSQVVPFTQQMREEGIETLAWLGQWEHAFPSYPNEHRNVRWDWADRLLDWFDHYLKGEGERPWLGVEVEDSLYTWRREASFPPEDVRWSTREVPGGLVSGQQSHAWTSQPLEDALRFGGLPRLHFQATPTTPTGGSVFAELYDVWQDGPPIRLGWGAIDLRYHDGGNTDPATLTPGQPVEVRMQFEPADVHVAENHRLRLVIHKDGVADIVPSPDPSPVQLSDVRLKLPAIERNVTVEAPDGVQGGTEVGLQPPSGSPPDGRR